MSDRASTSKLDTLMARAQQCQSARDILADAAHLLRALKAPVLRSTAVFGSTHKQTTSE